MLDVFVAVAALWKWWLPIVIIAPIADYILDNLIRVWKWRHRK